MEPMANIALRAGRLAGQHIVRGFDRPDLVKVFAKGHNDFVTNIDREAEQMVIETLREKYPDHTITGEESGTSENGSSDYEWIIDPLDGTTNFTRQVPHFCVSIACLHKGRIEHAVVLDAIRQEEFAASRGQGATLNGRRLRASELKSLDGASIATGDETVTCIWMARPPSTVIFLNQEPSPDNRAVPHLNLPTSPPVAWMVCTCAVLNAGTWQRGFCWLRKRAD